MIGLIPSKQGVIPRGLFGGGITGAASNVVDYCTIASAGNLVDFGDLTVARRGLAACSNNHGGVS